MHRTTGLTVATSRVLRLMLQHIDTVINGLGRRSNFRLIICIHDLNYACEIYFIHSISSFMF